MKKLSAFILAVIMVLFTVSSAFATNTLDLSVFRDSNLFEISVDSDQEIAFITTTLSLDNRSFTHELESDVRYNSFESDVLVLNYYSSAPYGILRTWIHYCADEFLDITSVSIYLGDKIYTFSGIADADWHYEYDDGIQESVLIKYGSDEESIDFLAAVEDEIEKYGADNSYSPEIKMILHGTKDVTASVGFGPLLDLYAVAIKFLNANGNLNDAVPSTIKVTNVN